MKIIDDIDTCDLTIDLEKLDGMDIKDLFNKAESYFISGFKKEAYFMFKKVIEENPSYIHNSDEGKKDNAYYYLGAIYELNLKELDGAIELYTKAVELCPNDGGSFEKRGYCWMIKCEYKKAIADFENALRKSMMNSSLKEEWILKN